jgi:CheY-like chemotaxis protein
LKENLLAKRISVAYLFNKEIKDFMNKGATILIVEDEDFHRVILKKILTDHGYHVVEAVNGSDGLEVMRTTKIDLVISDLEMPGMDGMEFTKWVKELYPKFPVVIVTAHASNFSPKEILNVNVDAFLHKPFNKEDLLKILERL